MYAFTLIHLKKIVEYVLHLLKSIYFYRQSVSFGSLFEMAGYENMVFLNLSNFYVDKYIRRNYPINLLVSLSVRKCFLEYASTDFL